MNPEQWGYQRGGDGPEEPPDAHSDLFALGVTLYQLLTGGKLPYGDVSPTRRAAISAIPIAPSRRIPEVPIWLDHVVLQGRGARQAAALRNRRGNAAGAGARRFPPAHRAAAPRR